MSNKKAIVVVSFGTSLFDARKNSIESLEKAIESAFPGWEVRRAFTSRMIIKKIERETGEKIDYIDDALRKLAEENYDTVVVQPTHFIKGIEYEDVLKSAQRAKSEFSNIVVSKPLLDEIGSYDDITNVLKSDISPYIKQTVSDDCAIVLMGHGSTHFSNACYSQLQLKLDLADVKDVYVTTVEGFPNFSDVLKLMKCESGRKVAILPFMVVAGVHAIEDMAGDEPESLKNVLREAGYNPVPVHMGMGEFEQVRRMFVDNCSRCIAENGL